MLSSPDRRLLKHLLRGLVVAALLAGRAAVAGAPAEVADARERIENGDLAGARALLEQVPPERVDAEVHRLLGEIDYRMEHWADAREHLREALRLDEIADDHLRLGEVYIAERKYALALAQFHNARRMGVLDGDLHYRLALAYFGLERIYGEVQRVAAPSGVPGERVGDTVLIEEIPDSPGTFWAAASDSAAYQITRARALAPDSPQARLLEARIWLAGRQYALAKRCFDGLVEDLPRLELSPAERADAWRAAAESAFNADDLDEYLRRVRAACSGDRDEVAAVMAEAHRRVAERYADRADAANCIAHLEQALAEAPRDVALRDALANRYWESGQPLRAAQAWRIVLQLAPEHPDRARILARLQTIAEEYGNDE